MIGQPAAREPDALPGRRRRRRAAAALQWAAHLDLMASWKNCSMAGPLRSSYTPVLARSDTVTMPNLQRSPTLSSEPPSSTSAGFTWPLMTAIDDAAQQGLAQGRCSLHAGTASSWRQPPWQNVAGRMALANLQCSARILQEAEAWCSTKEGTEQTWVEPRRHQRARMPHACTGRTRGAASPAATGTWSPGMKLRLTPSLLITTVRMQPPLEPSRAMAWDTAFTTNALHSSSLMLGCRGGRAAAARGASGRQFEGAVAAIPQPVWPALAPPPQTPQQHTASRALPTSQTPRSPATACRTVHRCRLTRSRQW